MGRRLCSAFNIINAVRIVNSVLNIFLFSVFCEINTRLTLSAQFSVHFVNFVRYFCS